MKSNLKSLVFLLLTAPLVLSGCKSLESPKYITHTETLADTLVRHEVESIILPQRNYVVFENPCRENILSLPKQTIENEHSSITVGSKGQDLFVEVDIDSIVNARVSEISTKSEVERIEVPIEVPYPVKNKLNWYMVMYSIGATIVIFRKPLWFLIRKLVNPLA